MRRISSALYIENFSLVIVDSNNLDKKHPRQMVLAGYQTTDCGPTVAIQPQFLTLSNPATAGNPLMNASVSVPGNIEQLVTGIGDLQAGAPVSFSTSGTQPGGGPLSSFGVDTVVNQQNQIQNQNQQPPCVSGGGNQQNCQQGPQ